MWSLIDGDSKRFISLERRHNERDGVSNHRHLSCLRNSLFRRKSKKTSKLRVSTHKGPVTRKCFHLMTSSCFHPYLTQGKWLWLEDCHLIWCAEYGPYIIVQMGSCWRLYISSFLINGNTILGFSLHRVHLHLKIPNKLYQWKEILPFWRYCFHQLHSNLWKWQLQAQPVMTLSSAW